MNQKKYSRLHTREDQKSSNEMTFPLLLAVQYCGELTERNSNI